MPIKQAQLYQSIVMKLSVLRYMVKTMTKRGKTDLNKQCESFYAGVLNIVYGYNLRNVNDTKLNSAAIDLADDVGRVCVQVTATPSAAKIKKTISSFIEKNLYERYDELHVLMLVDKLQYTTGFPTNGHFMFDKEEHIYDIDDVLGDAELLPLEQLEELHELVSNGLAPIASALVPNSLLAAAERVEGGPPRTGRRFLTALELDEGSKSWRTGFQSLLELHQCLSSLSEKQREVVAFILANGAEAPGFGRRVGMAIQTVTQRLRMDDDEFSRYFTALRGANLLDLDDDDDPQRFELTWPMESSWTGAFGVLKELLKAEEIETVIVACDFTLLD